ncbi:MAG TPA: SusE domain-containing protein [Parafilimonas sp.]|nr:SusE domain-containing protein [Parafilimonas sp.]
MKNFFKLIFCAVVVFASCKKEETVAYYEGGTEPVLTAVTNSGSEVINLSAEDSTQIALRLSWTNPDYMFNYGVSSLSVNYLVEIDTTGSNFTNPKRAQVSVSQLTDTALTEGMFNSYLTNVMGLDTASVHSLEIRVTASVNTSGNGVGTVLYSNVLNFKAKAFYPPPAVALPPDNTLYLVGGPNIMNGSNWDNSNPFKEGYQFTRESATLYTLVVALSGGDNTSGDDQFLFVPKAGDWSNKYAVHATSSDAVGGGVFGYNGGDSYWNANFPGPTSAGTYKITVDFQVGKYTLVKQ